MFHRSISQVFKDEEEITKDLEKLLLEFADRTGLRVTEIKPEWKTNDQMRDEIIRGESIPKELHIRVKLQP